MTMNALDTALVELAAASTALERSNTPGIKDVEEAKEKAKKAHKILESAHALLGYGVYTVAAKPGPAATPGTPMFDGEGQPTAEAEVVVAPQFDAAKFFDSKLLDLEAYGVTDGQKLKDWKKAEKAWRAEFKADPEAATKKLLWRLEQASISWGVPSSEEVA